MLEKEATTKMMVRAEREEEGGGRRRNQIKKEGRVRKMIENRVIQRRRKKSKKVRIFLFLSPFYLLFFVLLDLSFASSPSERVEKFLCPSLSAEGMNIAEFIRKGIDWDFFEIDVEGLRKCKIRLGGGGGSGGGGGGSEVGLVWDAWVPWASYEVVQKPFCFPIWGLDMPGMRERMPITRYKIGAQSGESAETPEYLHGHIIRLGVIETLFDLACDKPSGGEDTSQFLAPLVMSEIMPQFHLDEIANFFTPEVYVASSLYSICTIECGLYVFGMGLWAGAVALEQIGKKVGTLAQRISGMLPSGKVKKAVDYLACLTQSSFPTSDILRDFPPTQIGNQTLLNPLFWCAGCRGVMFPISLNIMPTGRSSLETEMAVVEKLLYFSARMGILKMEYSTPCEGKIDPLFMGRWGIRIQPAYPVKKPPLHVGGDITFAETGSRLPNREKWYVGIIWKKRKCFFKIPLDFISQQTGLPLSIIKELVPEAQEIVPTDDLSGMCP